MANVKGYNRRQLAVVISTVFEHRPLLLEKRREFCGAIAEE